jgi:hypothetical protein
MKETSVAIKQTESQRLFDTKLLDQVDHDPVPVSPLQ